MNTLINIRVFPKRLQQELDAVWQILPDRENHPFSNFDPCEVRLDNELLSIPYRLYLNEPKEDKELMLTEVQKNILNCLYLRHHDGFVRQRRLELLLNKTDYWIIPFTFQLLGEYVLEIIQVLDKHIEGNNIDLYRRFIEENPRYWMRTQSRVISYWDVYYRHRGFPDIEKYPGYQIVRKLL